MFNFWIIILFFIINKTYAAVSYNQPKFCPNATWNPNAITFADQSIVGKGPQAIFVTTNNTVYVVALNVSRVYMWLEGSVSPITVNFNGLFDPRSLFVTITGEIYVGIGINYRVEKSTLNATQSTIVMNVSANCFGIFIDINYNLYCVMQAEHKVIKKSLNNTTDPTTIVAGNGSSGSLPHLLRAPWGIFVDINFDLYVADTDNHRIQLFKPGELNATTLVGSNVPGTIGLTGPTGIVLDADKYLFILERYRHRITGQGPYGFRCLVGCSDTFGLNSDQLQKPYAFSFDSYGNMFVSDDQNNRIQKFFLSKNCYSCSPPKLQLIPSNPSPIEYKLNEDIYISSNIEFNCEELFSIQYQWIISNCTLNCSILNKFNKNITTTLNEIYFPSKILTFGIYEFKLTLNLTISSNSSFLSESIRIKIVQSEKLIVNLIEFGTSEITLGINQQLLIEPGKYSFHDDGTKLIENEWNFEYYCRIYDLENILESFSQISNSLCFSNRSENKTNWELNQTKSSLKIFANSFQSNQTYQFMVYINNRQNSTLINRGYLIVHIQDTFSHRISIGCVISTMCISDEEYQLINPTTQVSLFSYCLDNCSSNKTIQWNIYQGKMNLLTNITQWTQFNQPIITFGNNTNHFTVPNQLFLNNSLINYWKFEVIYLFSMGISSSSINFKKNSPPSNGTCSIDPQNGTTTTLFYISCSNWFDENEIKDYSFYVWTNDYSKRIMIGFSLIPTFKLRLPKSSLININVHIRDKYNSITEYNISSVYIYDDSKEIENLFENFKDSQINLTSNSFINGLLIGDQNDIGQILISISQEFNEINRNNLNNILSNDIPITSISISTLDSQTSKSVNNFISFNQTILDEYNEKLNIYANIREYLINFTINLPIVGLHSIILQSSSLVQLTQTTNQLTRLTLMIVSEKCYQLAVSLNETSLEISFEDVQTVVTLLIQCTSNILNGINGPLQQRTNLLQMDLLRSKELFYNEEENLNYQKNFVNKITSQINETILLLTLSLNKHFNFGQNFLINTSEVFMLYERTSINHSSNKQIGNGKIYFPLNFSSNLTENKNILIQSKLEALAPFGNSPSNTNFSRSLSFSILNENGNEISIKTNNFIELIIPRDPYLIFPEIILQNVTNLNQSFYFKLIHLKDLKPNKNLTISIHFQIEPLNLSVAYLFVYQFDKPIQLNQLDGKHLFCPLDLTNENLYQYYIDNQRLSIHQSIIFGLRELTSKEFQDICLNNSTDNFSIINDDSKFESNYNLRIYSSGCYYLDQYNNWQSDDLLVGPETNLHQTQCLTNHF